MSKIGPFENFDFWSKVNAKVKVNGQEKSTGYTVRVVSGSGHGSTAEMLMSSYDMALTRIKADEDMLAWLITSSNDIRMTSSGVLQCMAGACDDLRCMEGKPKTQAARGGVCNTR